MPACEPSQNPSIIPIDRIVASAGGPMSTITSAMADHATNSSRAQWQTTRDTQLRHCCVSCIEDWMPALIFRPWAFDNGRHRLFTRPKASSTMTPGCMGRWAYHETQLHIPATVCFAGAQHDCNGEKPCYHGRETVVHFSCRVGYYGPGMSPAGNGQSDSWSI